MNIELKNTNQIAWGYSSRFELSDFFQINIHKATILTGSCFFIALNLMTEIRHFKRLYFWLNTLYINVLLKLFTNDKNSKASTIEMLSQGYKLYM